MNSFSERSEVADALPATYPYRKGSGNTLCVGLGIAHEETKAQIATAGRKHFLIFLYRLSGCNGGDEPEFKEGRYRRFGTSTCSAFFRHGGPPKMAQARMAHATMCNQRTSRHTMIIPSSPLDLEISFASCQSTQNVTPIFAPGVNPRPLRLQYGRIENSQISVATNEIMKMAATIGGYLVSA